MHEVQRLIQTGLRDIHNWIKDERIINNNTEQVCGYSRLKEFTRNNNKEQYKQ